MNLCIASGSILPGIGSSSLDRSLYSAGNADVAKIVAREGAPLMMFLPEAAAIPHGAFGNLATGRAQPSSFRQISFPIPLVPNTDVRD